MSEAARAVLFDLDGTLADTAPDLGYALNLQRIARGLEPIPLEKLRPVASQGARGMLRAGFGLLPEHAGYEATRGEFLELYAANLFRETRLFDGMSALLGTLEARDMPWGIVTNKQERFTAPLVQALGLAQRVACVISGDTCTRAKPHPDPLLEAARRLGLDSVSCVYVGDDERDIRAGHSAGMTAVVALYGYLGEGTDPLAWAADAVIGRPLDLLTML